MQPEKTDNDRTVTGGRPNRIVCWGFIAYLTSAVLIAVICYLLGWQRVSDVGTGYLYGAAIMAIFGLLMAAVNSMPLQLSEIHNDTSATELTQPRPRDKTRSATGGMRIFLITLFGAALLGLTGFFLTLLFH